MIYEIVFSATGRTQKVADILGSVWQEEKIMIDLSRQDFSGAQYQFNMDDLCIVAVSVYSGRIPVSAAKKLRELNGNGATAVLTAVYGNRAVDDCLLEMKDVLSGQGFRCGAAIEAVAEHSIFPQYGAGRPDAQDSRELEEFAVKIRDAWKQQNLSENLTVPGKKPYVKPGSLPLKIRVNKNCVGCKICADNCPAGAISKEYPEITDSTKCMVCMRCISICPEKARSISPILMKVAGAAMKKALGGRKENKLYL